MHGSELLLLLLQESLVIHLWAALTVALRSSHHLLLVSIGFLVRLLDHAELLMAHLEIDILALLDLDIDTINFKLVGVDLSLVILEFSDHLLELLSAFLKISLILVELLSDIWTTLFRKNVFQLDVQLLFLLNKDIFFRNFFRFGNEALLQALNLLNQFISLYVSRFKFSPSVNIEWLLKFIG